MSGSASFNSKFELTPMREPIQKTKGQYSILRMKLLELFYLSFIFPRSDSVLSADAPEFIPRVCKVDSVRSTQSTPQLFHRNQSSNQIANQNAYRNHNHVPHHQYSVNIHKNIN